MNTTAGPSADKLRARMVDGIISARRTSPRVEQAMRVIPRHIFVPDAGLAEAYGDDAVITKRAADGTALSCASVPGLVAVMLDKLDIQSGHRILEIGAGTGYNAALLAQLTGPGGTVTTIDIDPDVTARARIALAAAGFPQVRVFTGDGQDGVPAAAPYDRIMVTVGAQDIPASWWDQLRHDGRLVVPLGWRGQTRAVAFARHAGQMTSDWVELCGFVPMIGQDGEVGGHLDPERLVSLVWDSDQNIDIAALDGVLSRARPLPGLASPSVRLNPLTASGSGSPSSSRARAGSPLTALP